MTWMTNKNPFLHPTHPRSRPPLTRPRARMVLKLDLFEFGNVRQRRNSVESSEPPPKSEEPSPESKPTEADAKPSEEAAKLTEDKGEAAAETKEAVKAAEEKPEGGAALSSKNKIDTPVVTL